VFILTTNLSLMKFVESEEACNHVVDGPVYECRVEAQADPTAHAEMLCIRSAAAKLGGWRLLDATLYVTLEPCPMCAGAILQARIGQLVWGARNSLLGADGSWIR
jgi:tRNA(Arg) A34 adenosine deaminase TadA